MIPRNDYLNLLKEFKDKELIKVATGIRRCAKSTLYELYRGYLKSTGVAEEQMLAVNLEDPEFDEIKDHKDLYGYVSERLLPDKKNYVFLDEVQKVKDFQEACDGLYIK